MEDCKVVRRPTLIGDPKIYFLLIAPVLPFGAGLYPNKHNREIAYKRRYQTLNCIVGMQVRTRRHLHRQSHHGRWFQLAFQQCIPSLLYYSHEKGYAIAFGRTHASRDSNNVVENHNSRRRV